MIRGIHLWEQSLLAMDDNAIHLKNGGACIAGKPCSHK
jgi:hypothetical protein